MKKTFILFIAILAAAAFTGTAFAQNMHPDSTPNTADSRASKYNWTLKQIEEWQKQPWSKQELSRMGEGEYVMKKDNVLPRHVGNNLTPKQLYENGRSVWFPIVAQYGIGINTQDFKKLWIDQEKWKDPDTFLLDVRNEYEYNMGHIPGAIRVDPGLDYWRLATQAPKQNATYYLQCKGGTPGDAGDRGAFTKQHMIDMGYTGPIINLTDGFRGWMEAGFPVQNFHGRFTHVKGTFQSPDPYGKAQLDKGAKQDPWAPIVW
jgi:rhodanese-related sulfurtransferase